ncbi:MAG: TonB-dependent receptor [Acidobacteriaceae bacterium]|nr:TonB-dependent receptor [Acidobacteriaceae bacterium]
MIKHIATSLVAASLLRAAAQNTGTSNQNSAPVKQETVVVTGLWEPTPLAEADRSVNEYSLRDAVVLFGSLADVFDLDSSVNVQARDPSGIQADFSIRGGSFEQTLILLNGIRISDEQSAHYNSDIPVPLDAIDHIEVLRGSGSTLYGSDAVGGVINIITRPSTEPDPIEMRVRGGYGSFGTNEQSGFLSLNRGLLSQRFSFERELSRGFKDDRDFRNLALSSESWVRSRLGLTRVFLGLDDRPFGADQFYGNFNSWERTKTWLATIAQDIGKKTLFTLGYRRHADLFVLLRTNPGFYTNRHEDEAWDLAMRRHDGVGRLAQIYYGVEGTADHVASNNLGVHSRKQGAVYGDLDIRSLRRASLSIGAREQFYGARQTIFAPNVSGGYWLSSIVKMRASASRAFRLPNYTDLYYHDPANLGNADLKPERAANYEAGVDWNPNGRLRVTVTGFHRREQDDIDYVRPNSSAIWQATNFDHLRFTGWEGSVAISLPSAQSVAVEYTGLHGAKAALSGLQSKYVFNYPTQQAVVAWQRTSARGWLARVRVGATDQYQRNAYVLVDGSAAWTRSRFHPYARFTNLANVEYQPVYGVAMPGRAAIVGMEICVLCNAK